MADPSPTTVGIIDAKIKLDAADFMAKIEEVKAAVDSLDRQHVNIRLDVDAAAALAKIEEVRAAAAAAGAGHIGLPGHSGGDGGSAAATAAQTAATDALGGAQRREAAAAATASEANQRLASNERQAARGAAEQAAASEAASRAGRNMANSDSQVASSTGLIVAGVTALIGMVAPLTGYLVGVAGGFGMMAAAGILAVIGIKNAMSQGTAEGERFRAGLDLLNSDMTRLAATSAHAVAPGFFQSIHEIQSAMPMLNNSMGAFGGILGQTVAAGVQAVINVIRTLNPLFLQGALYVRDFARGLASFGNSNGLRQFGDYAISVLPRVGQVLAHIVQAALDLAQALAPLGSVLLNVADAIALTISFLSRMGPLMSIVVGGALAVYAGFAAWRGISVIITGVTAAIEGLKVAFMGLAGPVGLAVAAIALIVGVIDRASHAYNTGALGVSAYSNALLNSNGHVNQAINGVTALQVRAQGLAPALRTAGVSQQQFSNAVLKGGSTLEAMITHMRNANEGARTYAVGAGKMVNAQNQVELGARRMSAGVQEAVKAYNQYRVSLGLTGNATGKQLVEQTQLAASMHTTVGALTAAQAAQKNNAAQAAAAAAQFRLEGNAAGLLNLQLQKLNGEALSDAASMGSFASAVAGFSRSSLGANTSLKGLTVSAIGNRAAVAGMVGAAQQAIAAYANQAHTAAQVTAEMGRMKSQMIAAGVAAGLSKTEVTALVNSLFKMPKNIETKVTLRDEQAKAALAQTNAAVNKFTGAPHEGKITANNSNAISNTSKAQAFANQFSTKQYLAQLKANGQPALTVTQQAIAKALGFTKGQYQAILRANNGAALSSTATASQRAMAFARATYQAILKANPGPANSSSAQAKAMASNFAHAFYQAILRGDPSQAIAAVNAAKAAVRSFNGMTAVSRITVIHTNETINKRLGRAYGGTIGMAAGGTPGTVKGAGSGYDDMAGIYALANGEEVISNASGQADRWRPLLKAINSGRVSLRTFEDLGGKAAAGASRKDGWKRQVNVGGIHIHHPVTQDPVTAAQHAAQDILAYVNFPG